MTTPTSITCDQFAETLADFMEHDIDERTRSAMEMHAAGCAECGALLTDLKQLRVDAAKLPELQPSRDLWAGIEARIATPVVELAPRVSAHDGQRRRWLPGGVAAAALILATAGVTHVLTRRAYAPQTVATSSEPRTPSAQTAAVPTMAATPLNDSTAQAPAGEDRSAVRPSKGEATTQLVARTRPSAEQTYDAEIGRLRAVIQQRRSQLDPATLAIIEKNMAVIDDAIAQCKAALRRDPASRFLMQSLNNALDNKVELLRTAAMLPARTS